jgi:type IV secretory pathway ATPase VirB11/archaellum biosynthesis ATPase
MSEELGGFGSLEEALRSNPHLAEYLETLEGEQPVYAVQLTREMRYMTPVNVLYPIGDPYFVHIYSDPAGVWNNYRVVMPEIPPGAWSSLKAVEEALAVRLAERDPPESPEEKRELLSALLEEVVSEDPSMGRGEYRELRRRGAVVGVVASPELAVAIRYAVISEKVGLGVLEPLIRDPYIEDVSCNGVGAVYVVHKVFGPCRTNIFFEDEKTLDQYVYRLSLRAGRPVSIRSPITDAVLPDGSRVNIVYGSDISRRGTNFTIRKFTENPISITQLIRWNMISARCAAYLWLLLEHNLNVWFVGETASGKTTLLRAASVFIDPSAKIVSIEDVPEIVVPHENWVSEVTRQAQEAGEGVELFDLLKAALRQRPNYILVGEIRGREAAIAFQAMQCVADAYVASPGGVISIPELYSSAAAGVGAASNGEVRLNDPFYVYATAPGEGVGLAKCVGVKRMWAASTVRVETSDGLSIVVTPNHRFITLAGGQEVEIAAEELLNRWRAGERSIALAKRPPPNPCIPLSIYSESRSLVLSGDSWWALGRLAGGDFLTITPRGFEWVTWGRGAGLERLRAALRRLGWRGGERWAEVRGRRATILENIDHRLVHWALMQGHLYRQGEALLGTDRAVEPAYRAHYLSGAYSAIRDAEPLLEEGAGIWANGLSPPRTKKPTPPEELDPQPDWEPPTTRFELHYVKTEPWTAYRAGCLAWVLGCSTAVHKAHGTAYLYHHPSAEAWITSVEPAGGAAVYDLVLEGGGYYMGGLGPAHPIQDTGHGVLSTFHAGSVQKLVQRLTGDPINIPRTFVDNLNCIVILSAVRHPVTGKLERRVLSVNELLGLDPETGGVNYVEVFTWNPVDDSFEFRGEGTSYLLEEKIAKMRGIPRHRLREVYEELRRRAGFLQRLADAGVLDYKQVYRAVAAAYNLGLEEAERVALEGAGEA